MGYHMNMESGTLTIKREKFPDALAAIKALAGKETVKDSKGKHFSWVDEDFATKYDHLHDMMEEWRWELEYDDDGNVDGVQFTGEKIGDDKILFDAIAPFVESGVIAMRGEDGAKWKWVFDGTACKEVGSEVTFEDDDLSEQDKRRFLKVFMEFMDGAPEITVREDDSITRAKEAAGGERQYIQQLFADFLGAK